MKETPAERLWNAILLDFSPPKPRKSIRTLEYQRERLLARFEASKPAREWRESRNSSRKALGRHRAAFSRYAAILAQDKAVDWSKVKTEKGEDGRTLYYYTARNEKGQFARTYLQKFPCQN